MCKDRKKHNFVCNIFARYLTGNLYDIRVIINYPLKPIISFLIKIEKI